MNTSRRSAYPVRPLRQYWQTVPTALLVSLMLYLPTTLAGTVNLPGTGGMVFTVAVTSFQEQKFARVIPQAYDFSCGSAAVATLLTFHFEQTVTEHDIFIDMYQQGDQALIQSKGFSLLDMKRYLERRGYKADGFRISLDKLREVGVPAIALIDTNGYTHFIVIKAVDDRHVIVGDSALGMRALSRSEFEGMWNGILFLIHNHAELAKRHFNKEEDWAYLVLPPLDQAVSQRTLAEFTLSLPVRSHDY
ncbi:MAG: C39 family peptidase [Parahaliea sp.]